MQAATEKRVVKVPGTTGCDGQKELGRVAKVPVNARRVAPNRRATRRSVQLRGAFGDTKLSLAVEALENCYFVLTRSLQRKSLTPSLMGRAGNQLTIELWCPAVQRLKLNSPRSAA